MEHLRLPCPIRLFEGEKHVSRGIENGGKNVHELQEHLYPSTHSNGGTRNLNHEQDRLVEKRR